MKEQKKRMSRKQKANPGNPLCNHVWEQLGNGWELCFECDALRRVSKEMQCLK